MGPTRGTVASVVDSRTPWKRVGTPVLSRTVRSSTVRCTGATPVCSNKTPKDVPASGVGVRRPPETRT